MRKKNESCLLDAILVLVLPVAIIATVLLLLDILSGYSSCVENEKNITISTWALVLLVLLIKYIIEHLRLLNREDYDVSSDFSSIDTVISIVKMFIKDHHSYAGLTINVSNDCIHIHIGTDSGPVILESMRYSRQIDNYTCEKMINDQFHISAYREMLLNFDISFTYNGLHGECDFCNIVGDITIQFHNVPESYVKCLYQRIVEEGGKTPNINGTSLSLQI